MRYVKLEEICFKGVSSLRQKDTLPVGDYPVYGASGICGYLSGYQHNEPYVAVVKDGAGVGRVQLCSGKSSVLGTLQALLPKDEVSCEYLYEVVRSLELGVGFTGSTIPHIYFKDYKNRTVVIYEKEQQTKITTLFTTLKNVVELHKCAISFYDELVKSRFVEMFGDPISSLKYSRCLIGDLAVVSSGATPSRKKPEYYEGTIPWVKTGEVAAGNIDETEECITEAAIRDSACRILPAGTILIAMYGQGDTRGKSAILNIEAATNQACAALEFKDEIDARFALTFLQLCYDDLRNLSQGGNQKNLNLKIIKEYSMLTPPVYLQKEFANFVAQVDKLKFETQQSIEKLQMLYDSLAQEYFAPEGD